MFLSGNKKNNVYPCKPQFYNTKVGFKWCFRDAKGIILRVITYLQRRELGTVFQQRRQKHLECFPVYQMEDGDKIRMQPLVPERL